MFHLTTPLFGMLLLQKMGVNGVQLKAQEAPSDGQMLTERII